MKFYSYALAMAVAAGVMTSNLKPAYGELVFEDDLKGSPKAENIEAQPAAKQGEPDKDMGAAERMRRQRLREELKNEDRLTQKLEELRLKDEMKRTDELLGSGVKKGEEAPMQEQRVGAAVAESAKVQTQTIQAGGAGQRPVDGAMGNTAVDINGAPAAGAATNQMVTGVSAPEDKDEFTNRVSVSPRFGTSSITGSMYDVSAKFATGLNISVDVSDYIAFSGGYTYSSYGIGAGSSLSYPTGFNQSYLKTVNLNDNVIDAGVKAYFLSPKSRVRPFVGGGGAYRKGFVNYDDKTQAYMKQYNPYAAQDVEITGFSAYVETGLEFKITKSISLTGTFRYFNLLSSKQSNPLDPNAFLNQNGYGAYGYNGGLSPGYYGGLTGAGYGGYGVGYSGDTRSDAGSALAKNNFYQLMAGLTISF